MVRHFEIGDRVLYRGSWGQYKPQPCIVTGVGEKNGRTIYDNDLNRWGYTDQYEPDLSHPWPVSRLGMV